jgi:hypothetical protein
MITVCLTSCGRFDLLTRTIESLIKHWDGPKPVALYIYEDSGVSIGQEMTYLIKDYCRNLCPVTVYADSKNVGQITAVDRLYSLVETPYIFHCEDDWEFYQTSFIQSSLDILQHEPKVMQVWLRDPKDRNGHPASGPIHTHLRTHYQHLSKLHARGQWRGFSFNPGLRRLSDYQRLFPNGYAEKCTWDRAKPWMAESQIGQVYWRNGFVAATLLRGYVKHLGQNRHIY